MRDRILLIGTSFSAAPLAQCLKQQGKTVSVCGSLPYDPCVAWADTYFQIDYSDPHTLKELITRESFSALCPSCNDYAYLSAAPLAAELGYPGFDHSEVALILSNKAQFRVFAARHGLPIPKAKEVTAESCDLTGLDYPLLVKPTDSFSGRGVTRIENQAALNPALASARKVSRQAQAVVVEEFIEGSLHSHSAFLKNQTIAADFFVDEFCTVYPYQVDCSNSPSCISKMARIRIRECITELAYALHLCDGLLHTQFLVRNNEVYLVECMRRCPGDLFYHLVTFSTGAPYIENYLRPFLGESICFSNNEILIPWARHTISLPADAIVWSFGHNIPSNEVRMFPLRESGSLIRHAPFDKLAILFARFENNQDLFKITPTLRNLISLNSMEM